MSEADRKTREEDAKRIQESGEKCIAAGLSVAQADAIAHLCVAVARSTANLDRMNSDKAYKSMVSK